MRALRGLTHFGLPFAGADICGLHSTGDSGGSGTNEGDNGRMVAAVLVIAAGCFGGVSIDIGSEALAFLYSETSGLVTQTRLGEGTRLQPSTSI